MNNLFKYVPNFLYITKSNSTYTVYSNIYKKIRCVFQYFIYFILLVLYTYDTCTCHIIWTYTNPDTCLNMLYMSYYMSYYMTCVNIQKHVWICCTCHIIWHYGNSDTSLNMLWMSCCMACMKIQTRVWICCTCHIRWYV